MIYQIDQLKARLDARRPLSPEQIRGLQTVFEAEETEYIYESNAIEGNTLTLPETELVLRKGITVSGKPLKDHLEATNHLKAFRFLKGLVEKKEAFSERVLLELHALILRGIEDEWAGRYRNVPVRIGGSRHVPPNPMKVPELMTDLFEWYVGAACSEHPVHVASDLHLRISQIHPFIDGNGRVARLVMNLHLMSHGYPLTIIHSEQNQRVEYYNVLSESDKSSSVEPFRRFIEERVIESLNRYLEVLNE
ncbi:MAG: Fic family protein [Opitutales bacterium]